MKAQRKMKTKPETENLQALLSWSNLNAYQKSLAKHEFEKLLSYVAELEQLSLAEAGEKKPMDEDYRLIPMSEIDDEARIIAVRWHEASSNWIGDKHKLASDIMNYARRKNNAK